MKQYDTSERLKDDQFGYSSIHIVAALPSEWLKVPTMSGLEDLKAEIQVRTLAQHPCPLVTLPSSPAESRLLLNGLIFEHDP